MKKLCCVKGQFSKKTKSFCAETEIVAEERYLLSIFLKVILCDLQQVPSAAVLQQQLVLPVKEKECESFIEQ
ncbi:MAG TPA: hypothetical protein VFJ43_07000 [Bacteroidia bacterium]|nr:hypothetical protein [Bacteroidia bacterium]